MNDAAPAPAWARALAALVAPPGAVALAGLCRLLNLDRPAHRLDDGALVIDRARLPLLPGFAGITLGRRIYVRRTLDGSLAARRLLAHEREHVRQFATLGFGGMTARYVALWLRHGYAAHPMERAARAAEARVTA